MCDHEKFSQKSQGIQMPDQSTVLLSPGFLNYKQPSILRRQETALNCGAKQNPCLATNQADILSQSNTTYICHQSDIYMNLCILAIYRS